MKTWYTVALSMVAGAALGGAAVQGVQAQLADTYARTYVGWPRGRHDRCRKGTSSRAGEAILIECAAARTAIIERMPRRLRTAQGGCSFSAEAFAC
jgi:hypothetical protein